MNRMARNSFVLFFILLYAFSVINSGFSAYNTIDTETDYKERVYLTEVSKLIFPQVIEIEGQVVPITIPSNSSKFINFETDALFGLMSENYVDKANNYIRLFELKTPYFPPEKYFYLFYDFW